MSDENTRIIEINGAKIEIDLRKARVVENYIGAGKRDAIYEEVFRDVLLAAPDGKFTVEDITGLPWIEIDFAADIER